MSRILVAEDDRLVSSFVGKGLRSHGFAVGTAETGEDAVALCRTGDFDLMLLDMGLPDTDGLNVLRRVREDRLALPVIVLTGRPERDVVTCLHAGADDYLAKPFAFTELLARVEARLRVTPSAEPELLQAGDLVLDLHTRRARAGGRSIDLTGREFALLETFMRHADQVLSRQQVLSHVGVLLRPRDQRGQRVRERPPQEDRGRTDRDRPRVWLPTPEVGPLDHAQRWVRSLSSPSHRWVSEP